MSSPISGFTAIPNPQMLAFMPIQSYLMMFFAGAGWQIGKRKISAIPNDAFNRMSINDLLKTFTADLKETIPTMERSLQDVTPLVGVLVEQYGDFVKEAIRHLPVAVQNLLGLTAFQADNFGVISAFLDKNLPPIPKDISAGATGTKTLSREFIDTSGMTLAQHEANKKEKARLLALAQVQRRNELQRIGIVKTPTSQLGSTSSNKRPAGQSARMERTRLISAISEAGKELRDTASRSYRTRNNLSLSGQQQDIAKAKIHLFNLQQKLINLLARYRF